MNMIRALGRGIASPTAVPRRPPSPSDRTTGRDATRSRSPPNRAHRQPPGNMLTLVPAHLPADLEGQEGMEGEAEENGREEIPDTP
eukprot:114103-Prorocentrum_minimum.AAC.1